MDEIMDTPRKPLWLTIVATVVVLLPLLYIVAAGPLGWMVEHGIISGKAAELIIDVYAPVTWIYDNAPQPVREVLKWYSNLWVPAMP